jgi:antitoxin component HigA of HigAB toxin-antitoxin module
MIEQGAPRIIRGEEQLKRYTQALFKLTAKDEPTEAEVEAIELLSLLIELYELEHYPIQASEA